MEIEGTQKIAQFIAETGYQHIPSEAIRAAKRAIIDWVGVTLAGHNEPGPRILAQYARELGSSPEAGVFCRGFKTGADLSAWVNGTAGHASDYDDTISGAVGYNFHPTVPVLPAVLALGEKSNASGSAVLVAYVIGIEVEFRVGGAIGPQHSRAGWHPTPILGTIGAVAACANLLGLNAGQVRMAMGIAGSFAGGLRRNFGTMTKPLHAGNAARNGVVAALLARSGFSGNGDILEGDSGFCSIFSGGAVNGIGSIAEDLGKTWHIVSPGLSIKPYPCCRSTHSSIDASLDLRNVAGVDANRIAKIICRTSPDHLKLAGFLQPQTAYEGKFSIPYCIAAALLRGKLSLEDFTDEKVADPSTQVLLSKVDFEYPDEYTKGTTDLTQEVVVQMRDGSEYSRKVKAPKGESGNPMTDQELSAKFMDCARLSLSQGQMTEVLDIIARVESLDRISRITDLLTFHTLPSAGV